MNVSKTRGIIILLSFLSVIASFTFENEIIGLALMGVCMLAAILTLYRHLADLTDLSKDNPKMKTLKGVTIFDTFILILCVVVAVLIKAGILNFSQNNEKSFAAMLVCAVILFIGNIAPKLPFNKHTGLRLPWTVTDEDTWVVAHRILGYISIPLAFIYIAGIPLIDRFEALTIAIVLLWVGIPGVLSYIFYSKKIHGSLND